MSTKKPREPRKPLNQSFLEFVHGNDSDLDATENPRPEPDEFSDHHWLELKQAVALLQQRLEQIEPANSGQILAPDLERFRQLESQLLQLLQRIEQLEQHTQPQFKELRDRMTALEHLTANLPSLDEFDDRFQSLSQPVVSMETKISPQHTPVEFLERLAALERGLKEQWQRDAQSFHRIETQLVVLTQQVEQLSAEVQQLSAGLQHSVGEPIPAAVPQPQPDSQLQERLTKPLQADNSPQPTDSAPVAVLPPGADPLLSRLSTLLDDF
jgi:DNA repair exonuclease SbcCD ATPase subunit